MVYLQLPSLLYGTNWPGTVSLYHILRNSSYYCQPYGLNWPGTVSHNDIIWNICQAVYERNWLGTVSPTYTLRNYAITILRHELTWDYFSLPRTAELCHNWSTGRPDLGPGTVLHNYLIWDVWHHWSKGQTDLGVLTYMQQNMSADAISGPREIEEQQERFPPSLTPPHLPTPGLPWKN